VDGDLWVGRLRTLAVGLVAALDKADAVLGEVTERVDHRVHGVHGERDLEASFLFALLTRRLGAAGFARASRRTLYLKMDRSAFCTGPGWSTSDRIKIVV
jgi:hypothetical protein